MEPIDYEVLAKLGIYGFEIHWRIGSNYTCRSGIAHAKSQEDAIEIGRFFTQKANELKFDYEITVYEQFHHKWIRGWDSRKERVANPKHCVFVVISGTDCDHMNWCDYASFRNLEEATEYVNESLSSADGPTSYSTMGRDEWENGGYPNSHDRLAEAAGY